MQSRYISLLYPSQEAKENSVMGKDCPNITEFVCHELGFTKLLSLKNSSLSQFFTTDTNVIRFRQEIFEDMIRCESISLTLCKILPILHDIVEIRQLESQLSDSDHSSLYSVTEIELYVSCMNELYSGLYGISQDLHSSGLKELCLVVKEVVESDYFVELTKRLAELSTRVNEIKSVTIGVNLDSQLKPYSAGVISVNSTEFKSGKLLDKILRMSFKNDAMTCISELQPCDVSQSENRKEALTSAFYRAIADVFHGSFSSWKKITSGYVLENTDFLLRILPEIEFLTRSTELMRKLTSKGHPLVFPEVYSMQEKKLAFDGIYNPVVALEAEDKIVPNQFEFDKNGEFYILTGPNRGGKSVITCAVGMSQLMFQLGMMVPAEHASMSPVDGIFTHFPDGADDTINKGRLGEECTRLKTIFDSVTEYSLVLLDESLSSTGAYEASYIASEIIAAFATIRCHGIFSTHLHELASSTDKINEISSQNGGIVVDNLVACIDDGKRLFHIERKKPDGKSYAKDIANKYGISFDTIIENNKNRGK